MVESPKSAINIWQMTRQQMAEAMADNIYIAGDG